MLARLLISFCLMVPLAALAQAPPDMSYQGQLIDASGELVTGAVNIQLRIYESETPTDGETPLFMEDHDGVEVAGGVFHLLVGQGSSVVGSFDPSLFSSGDRYLELRVNGERMEPRQVISAVPYAFQASHSTYSTSASVAALADDSTRLGGLSLAELTASIPTPWTQGEGQIATTDQVVIGDETPAPTTELHVAGDTVITGDTVINGGIVAGPDSLDVVGSIGSLQSRASTLESELTRGSLRVYDGLGNELGVFALVSSEGGLHVYNDDLGAFFEVGDAFCFDESSCDSESQFENFYWESPDCEGTPHLELDGYHRLFAGGNKYLIRVPESMALSGWGATVPGTQLSQRSFETSGDGGSGCLPFARTKNAFEVELYESVDLPFPYPIVRPVSIRPFEIGPSNPSPSSANVLAFDGVDDWVVRGDLPPQLLGGAAKFVGAWVRPEASAEAQTVLYMGTDTSGGGAPGGQTFELIIDPAGNVTANTAQWYYASPHVIPFGEWSYVFALWNPALGQYAVGALTNGFVSKTYVTFGNSSSQKLSSGPVYLGAGVLYGTLGHWPFNGEISQVSLLDHVPTDSEILALASGPADPASVPGLVAYWSLNQDTGTSVVDDTGNGWDLTLQNGASWQPVSE
ncbi:LamG domain-containing protein [Myxococcota bacterium]|nr:LamG domain-containing protein [Myxococcota bacterium]